jgi:hypothetical protein
MRSIKALVAASLAALLTSGIVSAQVDAPVGGGGRVDVPEAGYGITLPDDWVSVRPSAADLDTLMSALGEVEPELVELVAAQLGSGISMSLIGLAPVELGQVAESCNVVSAPHGGMSAELILAQNLAFMNGMDLTSGPEVRELELAAGAVPQVDYGMEIAGADLVFSAWFYVDDEQLHVLTCTGAERAVDTWGEIAASFELAAPA